MIALLKNGLTDERQELVHERFLAMLPRIRRQALVAFRDRGAEARQELAAEVVANAFCAYIRLVRRGKHDLAYPTPLAQYAIRQVRDGRRVGGRQNATGYIVSLRQQVTRFHGRAVRSKGSADWYLERTAGRRSPRGAGPNGGGASGSGRLVAHAVEAKSQDREGTVDGGDDR